MYFSHSFVILAIFSGVLPGVMAGPAANVNACIYLQTQPKETITFVFDPNGNENRCMYSTGNKVSLDVTESGLTCASVGFVEAQITSSSRDSCATDPSVWRIYYSGKIDMKDKFGAIRSIWSRDSKTTNEIKLFASATGAMVCGSKDLCSSTEFLWGIATLGPVYFIFQPELQAGLTTMQEPELVIQASSA